MKELTRIIDMFKKSVYKDVVDNSVTEYIDYKIKRSRIWKYVYLILLLISFVVIVIDYKTSLDIPFWSVLLSVLSFLVGITLSIVFTMKEIFYIIMKKDYKKYLMNKNEPIKSEFL
jgi:uncharacterized Tic20 family protein